MDHVSCRVRVSTSIYVLCTYSVPAQYAKPARGGSTWQEEQTTCFTSTAWTKIEGATAMSLQGLKITNFQSKFD